MSDAVMPRAGEVRVMENGMVCRFIESELEGEKWEVLGALYTGPATPVGGWQDISTAPKDGTNILAYDDGAVTVVFWDEERNDWFYPYKGGKTRWSDVTHWQPIPIEPDAAPPPPSVSTDKDGWIEWSGGENPAPGRVVNWRNIKGDEETWLSDEVAGWGANDRYRIIAYRTLPQTEKGS